MDYSKFGNWVTKNASTGWLVAVAFEKALKMEEQGYTFDELFPENPLNGRNYLITSPEGKRYTVTLHQKHHACDCPHYTANQTMCKHIAYARLMVNRQEEEEEHEAIDKRYREWEEAQMNAELLTTGCDANYCRY